MRPFNDRAVKKIHQIPVMIYKRITSENNPRFI